MVAPGGFFFLLNPEFLYPRRVCIITLGVVTIAPDALYYDFTRYSFGLSPPMD